MVGTQVLNVMQMNKTPAGKVAKLSLQIAHITIKNKKQFRGPNINLVLLLLDGPAAENWESCKKILLSGTFRRDGDTSSIGKITLNHNYLHIHHLVVSLTTGP
jgi:hypothetical protein